MLVGFNFQAFYKKNMNQYHHKSKALLTKSDYAKNVTFC